MSFPPDGEWNLLATHQRLIHKVCWAYADSPSDRDDLFQEIAVRLLTVMEHYDPARKLSTWIYRVALNVAIDFARKRRRRRRVAIGYEADQQPAPQEERKDAEELSEMRRLLEQQTEADRALLFLHLSGNSHREIGEVLGISESNVGTRLSRLKKSLRESAVGGNH